LLINFQVFQETSGSYDDNLESILWCYHMTRATSI